MTLVDQVRLRIQDRPRYGNEELFGDGYNATFKLAQGLPFSFVTACSAFARGAASYTSTGATFDLTLGTMAFSGTISANSAVKATYQWTIFSDDDINTFITAGSGTVAGAALEAVRTLLFDAQKRARWIASDGTQYDDTRTHDMLMKMYDQIWAELRETPEGGIEAWSEQQQYYPSEYPS